MTNPTQRFVMVKVTGCKDCPCAKVDYCYHPSLFKQKYAIYQKGDVFDNNKDAITESCPMYKQSQEVEK